MVNACPDNGEPQGSGQRMAWLLVGPGTQHLCSTMHLMQGQRIIKGPSRGRVSVTSAGAPGGDLPTCWWIERESLPP